MDEDAEAEIALDRREMEFLFSDKLECKHDGSQYEDPFPNMFSFNNPQGACPDCHGFGDLAVLDEFKEKTGIEVIYENFSTNEEMLAKLDQLDI